MLSKEELNHLFYVDAGTLYWKNPLAHRCNTGDVAGYKDKDGYMKVRFSGHLLPAHKVVWAMTYGEYPELLDHINGVRDDNSVDFDGNNSSIQATIDGIQMSVPLDPTNRHYAEIMRQVEAGTLTIAPAE